MAKPQVTPVTQSSAEGASAPEGVESTPTADLAAIGADLASSMPDVQEHAIAQAQREQQAVESAPTDKSGAHFDPSVHVTGPGGKGVLNTRGLWSAKRGRKAGARQNAQSAATVSTLGVTPQSGQSGQTAQQTALMQQQAQSAMAGAAAAEMLFIAGRAIGGEEWAPMENKALGMDERALMRDAFGEYFKAKGQVDIPPGVALTFAILIYAGPRFAMPKTQSRLTRVKNYIVGWWMRRKLRKAGLEPAGETSRKPETSEAK